MNDFMKGFISGAVVVLIMLFVYGVFSVASENTGYSEKLIIEYHSAKEYDRKLVSALVDASGVQTNFLNKVYSMDKYRIKIRFTNPE